MSSCLTHARKVLPPPQCGCSPVWVRNDTPVWVHPSVGETKVVWHNFLRSVFRFQISYCISHSPAPSRAWVA